MSVRLDADQLGELADQIADRLAERLAANAGRPGRDYLIDAAEVAARCGRTRGWVYDHRHALGAIALGNGQRPRLAFEPAKVDAYLAARGSPAAPTPPPRDPSRVRRAQGKANAELLPIRGRSG